VAGLLLFGIFRLWGSGMLSDEQHHFRQVLAFAAGDWSLLPSLTTFPTWHFLLSLPLRALDQPTLDVVRIGNLAAAATALAAFAALSRELVPAATGWRTLQLAALPLFLPYAPLVYTDIPAIAPSLLCLLMALKGRHGMAGLWGLIAVLLRQTSIVVLLAAACIAWIERPVPREGHSQSRRLRSGSQIALAYLPTLIVFILFVGWNGGVSVGEQEMHRVGTLHLGNVTLLFALLPLLFLPAAVPAWRVAQATSKKRVGLWTAVLVGGMLLAFSWSNDHPYNQLEFQFFLHNQLALWASADWLHRSAVGLLAASGVGLIFLWRPQRRSWAAVLLVLSLPLLGVALVEPRYLLLPIIVLQAGRPPLGERSEGLLFLLWMICSGVLLEGMATGLFFP